MRTGHITRCWTRKTWSLRRRSGLLLRQCRYVSTAGQLVTPAASPPSPLGVLSGLRDELDKLSPSFTIRASQIQIIEAPTAFFKTLQAKILTAQRRIFLSTLYIGKNEHELVSTIRQALVNNQDLRVSILTDALRGTREAPEASCASLLVPLVAEFGSHRVEIRMYHTPNLTGRRKKMIPKRINEGWGLQHMKLYGVDDELIMSGANLSSEYFTNRQDRYYLIASKRVTNYFASLHHAICTLSYVVQPDSTVDCSYRLQWPESNQAPAPLDDPSGYIACSSKLIKPLISTTSAERQDDLDSIHDTIVYPLSQLTPLLRPDTSTEYVGIMAILRHLASDLPGSCWTFTAGYFNIRPEIRSLLLASRCSRGTIITASPWSNGFYGSKGISGLLPSAYTLLSRQFLESVHRSPNSPSTLAATSSSSSPSIVLKEWRRGTIGQPGGWTYHAKGLWITLPHESYPSITLVGSSNYTQRSHSLDLETNLLVLTRNADLQRRLQREKDLLQEHARLMHLDEFQSSDRRVGFHVRLAMWIVSLVGGAL